MNSVGLYYKTYRRGEKTGPFCDNCTFYKNDDQVNLPGGSATVQLKDSSFITPEGDSGYSNNVWINNGCGDAGFGGLCASHYVLPPDTKVIGQPLHFKTQTNYGRIGKAATWTDALIFYNGSTYFDEVRICVFSCVIPQI